MITTRSLHYWLDGAFRRLSLRCCGDPRAPALVCVHGLTRTARDFDALAQRLSDTHYVVCPDLPGRGGSEWLDAPMLYTMPTYIAALAHVFASLTGPIDYLGTSLGGLCGIELAAAAGHPLRRMILNDIGPHVPQAALMRIRDYLCAPIPRFASVATLKLYLRRVHAPFGPLSDAQWHQLAADSARALPNGDVALHYDPAIAIAYAANTAGDLDMWAQWNRIAIPMLTLRGAQSDVLSAATLAAMQPKSASLIVPDTGHAPALLDDATSRAIREFLTRRSERQPAACADNTRAASSAK